MGRSLRRDLIGWLGLLLAVVLVAFGWTLQGRVSRAVLAGADASIESRGRAVLGALEWDDRDGWEVELSEEYMRGWSASGWMELRDRSGSVLATVGVLPEGAGRSARELLLADPRGPTLRVGRSIEMEQAALSSLLRTTVAAGLALCLVALCGGWWLATRTLRPLDRMSAAASRISERDLTQRIDPAAVPTELGELAHTLNDAFDRLERAFVRQARFTADASHELRTPLSVIRAQAELALRKEREPEQYRAALRACLGAAKRMGAIVEGLLALARADAGEEEVRVSELAFDQVVDEAARQAHAANSDRQVALHCDLSPVRIRGDSTLLAQVVSNLVENAVRHNRPGGHVDVSLQRHNGSAVLHVDDDGPGIPLEALPHLFDRFYRVDEARSRERGGFGLGLAIARWIVEAHGGAIRAENRPESGTSFQVTLPVADSSIA
jgi:heavy metal sensor kinase